MRIGSLFSGYGGADLAVQAIWPDATPAWFVEYDKAPSAVLAHHWPDVPNYGDVTAVDWSAVEPVAVLTGGYPCQPFSHAGKRKGTNDDRHLFPYVATAISVLRPRIVLLENVAGHLTLGGPEVIGTLTRLGYSVRWGVVRASDAGAPHRRARLFIVATAADESRDGRRQRGTEPGQRSRRARQPAGTGPDAAADSRGQAVGFGTGLREGEPGRLGRGRPDNGDSQDDGDECACRGGTITWDGDCGDCGCAAADTDGSGRREHGRPVPVPAEQSATQRLGTCSGCEECTTVTGGDYGPQLCSACTPADASGQRHGRGQDGGGLGRVGSTPEGIRRTSSAAREVAGDRSAAAAADADQYRPQVQQREQPGLGTRDGRSPQFGPYTAAITHWESVLGRPAPSPTEPGRDGRRRLNPAFVEHMMGLPAGHVTAVPGVSRVAQLKMLGNGIVWQQMALALRLLLADEAAA